MVLLSYNSHISTYVLGRQYQGSSFALFYFVDSGIEFKDEVFSAHQLQHADLKPKVAPAPVPVPVPVPITAPFEAAANGAIVSVVPSTNQIFAPRKKDMNKGYLMFSQDDEGLTSEWRRNFHSLGRRCVLL